ncbi:BrnT family toxin [candidate division KSB1 bacterium]|nr:BrnT family toxin [candidate division KSB1 bacterium]
MNRASLANGQRFRPTDFEYGFARDELAAHHVTFEEAVECFFSDFEVRRNKSYHDRYQLLGRTLGGRRLKIIFQLKPQNVVRIITGWPI